MPHPSGDAEVPVGYKGHILSPRVVRSQGAPRGCPRGAASTASRWRSNGLFIGGYGRGLLPAAAPALAQPGSSLPAPPVAPSLRAPPGRAPLSSYPGSVPLALASWGSQGSIVPPFNTPKPQAPPGAQPLRLRPQQERGAQGAPSTHLSGERGHQATLHRATRATTRCPRAAKSFLRRCSSRPRCWVCPHARPRGGFSRRGRCSCTG